MMILIFDNFKTNLESGSWISGDFKGEVWRVTMFEFFGSTQMGCYPSMVITNDGPNIMVCGKKY